MNTTQVCFVTGTRRDVEMANLNGSVHLEGVGGPAQVGACNSPITGSLAGSLDPGASWASLNGEIDLTLPPGEALKARLRAESMEGRIGPVSAPAPLVRMEKAEG